MIRACPRCAYTHFHAPRFADGIVPETDNLSEWVCERCDLRTTPLEFDEDADYEAFAEGVRREMESED